MILFHSPLNALINKYLQVVAGNKFRYWVFRGMYTSIPLHTTPVFTGIIAPSMLHHH